MTTYSAKSANCWLLGSAPQMKNALRREGVGSCGGGGLLGAELLDQGVEHFHFFAGQVGQRGTHGA
ncbi:hypothetical protein, partial [Achromobacter marplatensis]|uniref:hypothetical protein n=1 Tax=Achromobacter marplatensis TaxID=470868 RepID=UPI001C68D1E8